LKAVCADETKLTLKKIKYVWKVEVVVALCIIGVSGN